MWFRWINLLAQIELNLADHVAWNVLIRPGYRITHDDSPAARSVSASHAKSGWVQAERQAESQAESLSVPPASALLSATQYHRIKTAAFWWLQSVYRKLIFQNTVKANHGTNLGARPFDLTSDSEVLTWSHSSSVRQALNGFLSEKCELLILLNNCERVKKIACDQGPACNSKFDWRRRKFSDWVSVTEISVTKWEFLNFWIRNCW